MSEDKAILFKKIELIREYIHTECENYIYYPPEYNRAVFLRIKNAVEMLYDNAIVLFKQGKPLYKDCCDKISLQQTAELMLLIFDTLSKPELPHNIEFIVAGHLRKFNLQPLKLLMD